MSRILTVVAAQVRPVPFDAAATLQKFEEEVRMLRGGFPDADLYVFPELYLTGEHPFVHPPKGYDENAQPIPGPLTRAIGRIAKRAGRWIVAGSIVERDDDALYNTAVVFSPSGRLAARYRKVFTWRPFEPYAVGTEAAAGVLDTERRQGRRDDLLRRLVPGDGAEPRAPRGGGHRRTRRSRRLPTARRSWCWLARTRSRTSAT